MSGTQGFFAGAFYMLVAALVFRVVLKTWRRIGRRGFWNGVTAAFRSLVWPALMLVVGVVVCLTGETGIFDSAYTEIKP